jgi:hypothetical protein
MGNNWKVAELSEFKYKDRVKVIDLVTGGVTEGTMKVVGTTSFILVPEGVKETDSFNTKSFIVLDRVILLRQVKETGPENWPPRADDVWAIVTRIKSVATYDALYHMVDGAMRCNHGHVISPTEFLAKLYGREAKLVFRNGESVRPS